MTALRYKCALLKGREPCENIPCECTKPDKCKHDWQYIQDKNFDWFQCSKCGKLKSKTLCP